MEARKSIKRNSEKLLALYESWKLPEKLQFAANGHTFNLKHGKPAIELYKTTIKTVRNMSNGVRVTDFLRFIIIFSHLGTAKEFVRRKPHRFYQIKVGQTVYLMHTKPYNASCLGNFINAALRVSGDFGKAYRKHLHR